MVRLDRLFERFPKLTTPQKEEICHRHITRAAHLIPRELDRRFDANFAIGFCGLSDHFWHQRRLRGKGYASL